MGPHLAWLGVSPAAASGAQPNSNNSDHHNNSTLDDLTQNSRSPLAVEIPNSSGSQAVNPDGSLPRYSDPNAAVGTKPDTPGDGGAAAAGASDSGQQQRWRLTKKRVSVFVVSNFMLLSFSLAAALAMAWVSVGAFFLAVCGAWCCGRQPQSLVSHPLTCDPHSVVLTRLSSAQHRTPLSFTRPPTHPPPPPPLPPLYTHIMFN